MGGFRKTAIRTIIILAALALIGSFLFLSHNPDSPLTTFNPAGPFSERINHLFWPVFWIAAGVFILVEGGVLAAVFLFHDRDGAKEPKQLHGNPKLEVLWTVIPALILAGIAIPTTAAVFDLTECGSNSMEVQITGHQWWFEFHYPDADVSTANVMVIPAGEEVCAVMTSEDVIHNFWVPALNGKRYLIPGQTTRLRLEADQPGEYWGHCAEFCGLSHSLMRTRVVALSSADFNSWLAGQQAPAALPAPGTPEYDGYQVYQSKTCVQCHTVRFDDPSASNIVEAAAFNGPELTHFASRSVFAGATLPNEGESHDAALKRWLSNPPNVKSGSFMPNLALTEQEIDNLITWLDSNK